MSEGPLDVTLRVVGILDRLGIPYRIGGSVASSLHGEPRASQDVDIVVDLSADRIDPLCDALADGFYVSAEAAREAVRDRSCFNAIHLGTMHKVDFFVPGDGTFEREQMARRQEIVLVPDPERRVYVSSPEDSVLQKIVWYRDGGRVADQQWRDVLGVLKVQGAAIDLPYLRKWGMVLRIADLLEQAITEAGGETLP